MIPALKSVIRNTFLRLAIRWPLLGDALARFLDLVPHPGAGAARLCLWIAHAKGAAGDRDGAISFCQGDRTRPVADYGLFIAWGIVRRPERLGLGGSRLETHFGLPRPGPATTICSLPYATTCSAATKRWDNCWRSTANPVPRCRTSQRRRRPAPRRRRPLPPARRMPARGRPPRTSPRRLPGGINHRPDHWRSQRPSLRPGTAAGLQRGASRKGWPTTSSRWACASNLKKRDESTGGLAPVLGKTRPRPAGSWHRHPGRRPDELVRRVGRGPSGLPQ